MAGLEAAALIIVGYVKGLPPLCHLLLLQALNQAIRLKFAKILWIVEFTMRPWFVSPMAYIIPGPVSIVQRIVDTAEPLHESFPVVIDCQTVMSILQICVQTKAIASGERTTVESSAEYVQVLILL